MTAVSPTRPSRSRMRSRRTFAATTVTALVAGTLAIAAPSPVDAVSDSDWVGIVNTYRAMSGLDPITEDATYSSQAQAHSCYMLQNGITHDEIPGYPGYTPGGDLAGNNGNVAVSSSISADARDFVDLWMTGPFHAIGILRPKLASSGFGLCTSSNTPTPWASGGTLDVLRGLDGSKPASSTPIVFPGDGATVPLTRFITEYPNPLTMCGWSGNAGLPLIAMMPNDVSSATATITGPSGPIETCALHENNTSDPTAKAILGGDNAVIVMPREILADGHYSVTVSTNGGSVSWSFDIDENAPLEATPPEFPETEPDDQPARFDPVAPFRQVDSRTGQGTVRLRAGKITKVDIADPGVEAISANFVALNSDTFGHLTAYNCTSELPTVSTIGYGPGEVIANQSIIPLQNGQLCLYSLQSVDIVIDVNGYYRKSGGSGFVPEQPKRIYDTRANGVTKLKAGTERKLVVAGGTTGTPVDAVAVALNVTVTEAIGYGFLRVYPCGATSSGEISSINYVPNDARPNTVVTPVSKKGEICFSSLRDTEVIIDSTGHFLADGGFDFVALDPIRMFDSRSGYDVLNQITNGKRVRAGQVIKIPIAGERGVPADAKAVSINLTATEPLNGSFLTAYPCGTRPGSSNVNIMPNQLSSGNGVMVKLSGSGDLCVYALNDVHVIVDINGAWI